jgi:hypothetical protein
MAVALKPILAALEALPWSPPAAGPLTCAILADALRDLGLEPPEASDFQQAAAASGNADDGQVLLQFLAFAVSRTPLGVSLAQQHPLSLSAAQRLRVALSSMQGLPVAQVPRNGYRREEVLRKFLHAFDLPVESETRAESAARLEAVDFRRLKKTLEREEKERQRLAEAWARQKAAEQAAQRPSNYE